MKNLLLTTTAAVMLVGCGAYTSFASLRPLNEKINLSSKTSFEQGELKNKVNIEAKIGIRFAAYNVLFGLWAKPQSIGEMFKEYDLDVICFNEVPNGDWTARVGQVLGMEHVHVGKISSANHMNKYKSILCRFPLFEQRGSCNKCQRMETCIVSISKSKHKGCAANNLLNSHTRATRG